ncbi:MAG: hypothetical protein Q8S18_13500 [Bacteroidales bacterium]|nr:hypothetical protein [Bacteroidales bacterium]
MKINEVYTMQEIREFGLTEKSVKDIHAKVFLNGTKVYFFEPITTQSLRLYSIINKRSFFL